MGSQFGFRVYLVRAFENRIKDRDPLNAAVGSRVHRELEMLLGDLAGRPTYYFQPAPPKDGEPPRAAESLTVYPATPIRDDWWHLVAALGETGSHRVATRPDDEPTDLQGTSPEVDHEITFLFPTSDDDRFLVVAQTVRSRDPIRRLFSRITAVGLEKKQARQAADKAEREASKQAGDKPEPLKQHTRLLFESTQVADNEYLRTLIHNAKKASATFTSYEASARGSGSDPKRRTLTINIDPEDTSLFADMAQVWAKRYGEADPPSLADGVSEVAAVLEERDLLEDGESHRYDRAALSVIAKNGDRATIAVDTLREMFTYPVTDGRPPHYTHYGQVAPRVASIAAQIELPIRALDAMEADECLNASAFDLSVAE